MKGNFEVRCTGDGCLVTAHTFVYNSKEAYLFFINSGWTEVKDSWFCPECRSKEGAQLK